MLSLLEIITQTTDFFASKGVESARYNAEQLHVEVGQARAGAQAGDGEFAGAGAGAKAGGVVCFKAGRGRAKESTETEGYLSDSPGE